MLPAKFGHLHIPTTNVSYCHFVFLFFFIEKLHSGSYSILISQQLINGRYNILHVDPNSLSECYP